MHRPICAAFETFEWLRRFYSEKIGDFKSNIEIFETHVFQVDSFGFFQVFFHYSYTSLNSIIILGIFILEFNQNSNLKKYSHNFFTLRAFLTSISKNLTLGMSPIVAKALKLIFNEIKNCYI